MTVVDVYWVVVGNEGPFRVGLPGTVPALPTRLESFSAEQWEGWVPVDGTDWAGWTAAPGADVVLGKGVVPVHGAPVRLSLPDINLS